MFILVLNAGSSTYKCSLFDKNALESKHSENPLWYALLEWKRETNRASAVIKVQGVKQEVNISSDHPFEELLQYAWKGPNAVISGPESIGFVGHRVVHGGDQFVKPCLLDSKIIQSIEALSSLAPLHNLENLKGIKASMKLFPQAKQFAVFDTAFHKHMPEEAIVYPIPYSWREQKIRRYGFHGISHQYCLRKAEEMLGKEKTTKIITCHLGNGSSLAAIYQGKSIDTTMGFTPLEGLMMGTRSGSIDPGLLMHLLNRLGMEGKDLETMLLYESGLKGIAGTEDMRKIIKQSSDGDRLAKLAFEMYVHSVKKHIGAMAAILDGVDVLVFTGGIGENAKEVRSAILKQMHFLGVDVQQEKNFSCTGDADICHAHSKTRVLVIHTKEDLEIARQIVSNP